MARFCVYTLLLAALLLPVPALCATSEGSDGQPLPMATGERLPDDGWVMVVVPDTQYYADHSKWTPQLLLITQWIRSRADELGIALVVQVGDLVNDNGARFALSVGGDQNSRQQWENVSTAFALLDGVVPYITVTGNHDYGVHNAESRKTKYNEYFTPERSPLIDPAEGGILAEMGENYFGKRTLENAAYDFTAPDGRQWLLLGLEWGPRQAAVDWAVEVAQGEEYSDHAKLLVTHAYLFYDETRFDRARADSGQHHSPYDYSGTAGDTHDGEELWQELVGVVDGFRLVLCGHVGGDQAAYLASAGSDGTVHQLMHNAQFTGAGGDGWLRLLHFRDDGETVDVYTYSPVIALSGTAGVSPWMAGPQHEFSFTLD